MNILLKKGSGNIHVNSSWHGKLPLLAVGSYSEDKGGYVTVYSGHISKIIFFYIESRS